MTRTFAFKTRLKVNNATANVLAQWCGILRLAYNTCLDHWNKEYKAGNKPNYYSVKKWFNSVKRDMFPFITDCSKWVAEAGIQNLGKAFSNMFKHRARHPKFHKRESRTRSESTEAWFVSAAGKCICRRNWS